MKQNKNLRKIDLFIINKILKTSVTLLIQNSQRNKTNFLFFIKTTNKILRKSLFLSPTPKFTNNFYLKKPTTQ